MRWKFWRGLLLLVAGLITLLALYQAEENCRGRRAWDTYKSMAEAKGDSFDFAQYVPPPVPDDQNFAMTPFFAPLFDYVPGSQNPRDTNAVRRIDSVGALLRPFGGTIQETWVEGKPLDFAYLLRTNAGALQVLEKLKAVDPVLNELQEASRRPYSRFNIDYGWHFSPGITLQHLGIIKQLSAILELRACSELTLGRTDGAFQDVGLMFHLMNSIRNEPFLITQIRRADILTETLQPIWEGLAHRQWSDKQLADFTRQLRALDFLDDDVRALRGEPHLFDSFFASLRSTPDPLPMIDGIGDRADSDTFMGHLVGLILPRGWFYFEEVNYHRLYDEQKNDVMTPKGIDPDVAEQKEAAAHAELGSVAHDLLHHELISRILLPTITNFERRLARAQTYANLASVGCALERYRLVHGQFPEALDALAPDFLPAVPRDVITDQPLKYRLTGDGEFLLYSVGWNKKDDKGVVAKDTLDKTQGDWVWKYSPVPLAR
jgi:hypothetical protein